VCSLQGRSPRQEILVLDQYLAMAFAQFTYRKPSGYRGVPGAMQSSCIISAFAQGCTVHTGRCERNARQANLRYFAQYLIGVARPSMPKDSQGLGLDPTLYALDSTRSTCACRVSRGQSSAAKGRVSRCTPCWTGRANIPTFSVFNRRAKCMT